MTRLDSFDDLDDERPLLDAQTLQVPVAPELTLRAILAGLAIGTLICTSNCYFGLQTGWISMMSLPASLLGYGIFRVIPLRTPFTIKENVLVQTIAVASGTMPLAAGLVGVIPALEKLLTPAEGGPINLSIVQLLVWSTGVAFFGVFFTIPLRRQVLIKENLKFPSGTATAEMIQVLHQAQKDEVPYATKIRVLVFAFVAASIVTVLMFLIPILRRIPIFDIVTLFHYNLSRDWLLDFQPSLAYVGQGIIMGPNTTLSMLLGAIIGWCILSPIVKTQGWVEGPVASFDGVRGWLIWVSLAIMVSDSVTSLIIVIVRWLTTHHSPSSEKNEDEFPRSWTIIGIIASSLVCVIAIRIVFPAVAPWLSLISILLAMFLSILAVRALGETDLNPVSGIGKISQLLFTLITPHSSSSLIINLVAGGVAEAGAQQAGDLMQDLKTGYLLDASPRVQTYGQLIGSAWSVIVSVLIYKLYVKIYEIPGELFAIPTAYQWLDCARLVTGHGLPSHIVLPSLVLAAIFAVSTILRNLPPPSSPSSSHLSSSSHPPHSSSSPFPSSSSPGFDWGSGVLIWTDKYRSYLPSGLAVAVGIYNTPNFTLSRTLGGVLGYFYSRNCRPERRVLGTIVASGFILGEGVLGSVLMLIISIFTK